MHILPYDFHLTVLYFIKVSTRNKVLERSVLAVFVIAVTAALSGLHENMSFTSPYTGILSVLCF